MENDEIAIESGVNSQIGKRDAYQKLSNHQRIINDGECEITYFAMLTHYRISKLETRKKAVPELSTNQLLKLDQSSGNKDSNGILFIVIN